VILDIDHVGIAVDDLDASVGHYRRTLGVEPAHRERVEDQGVEEVLFPVGTSFIQLLGALAPDTPVGVFLAKRGPGEGITPIDEVPRRGSRDTLIAFVHPKDMEGVLVELVQVP